jgi:hypothetical protein
LHQQVTSLGQQDWHQKTTERVNVTPRILTPDGEYSVGIAVPLASRVNGGVPSVMMWIAG